MLELRRLRCTTFRWTTCIFFLYHSRILFGSKLIIILWLRWKKEKSEFFVFPAETENEDFFFPFSSSRRSRSSSSHCDRCNVEFSGNCEWIVHCENAIAKLTSFTHHERNVFDRGVCTAEIVWCLSWAVIARIKTSISPYVCVCVYAYVCVCMWLTREYEFVGLITNYGHTLISLIFVAHFYRWRAVGGFLSIIIFLFWHLTLHVYSCVYLRKRRVCVCVTTKQVYKLQPATVNWIACRSNNN